MCQACAAEVFSLYEVAFHEARRHRWIESQKCGCDQGNERFLEWYERHWSNFLRYRHLEHLLGDCQWVEFDAEAFGVLVPRVDEQDELAAEVIDLYRQGCENLDILNWALREELNMDEVCECLVLINMNDARFDARFN